MKTTAISENAYQLTRFGLVNCYLIRETDGLTLIDTGLSGSGDDILAAAHSLQLPIQRILLTHAHMDHVGAADELVAKLGADNVALLASERTVPLLLKPPDMKLLANEPKGKIKGGVPGIKATVTQVVAEGDLVGSLRSIETPGHIPGHFSFLDERDGTLYAGDALVAVGELSVSGFAPWYFPLPNLATWNKPTAVASAQKLVAYDIQRFACGHGMVRAGNSAMLREVVAKAH